MKNSKDGMAWLGRALGAFAFFVLIAGSLMWHSVASCQYPVRDMRQTVSVPVLMYHGITADDGLENTYFIKQSLFEADLDYLKENGYTTVSCQNLIDFVENSAPLPQKPVLITFDDGYANNFLYAYPLLKERNMVALISVIGRAALEDDADEYRVERVCSCSFEQLRAMTRDGTFEVGNHTFDLHESQGARKGATLAPGESAAEFANLLENDVAKCQALIRNRVGVAAQAFAWPYGAKDEVAEGVIDSMGFKLTFTCTEGFNQISRGDASCLKNLKRNLRSPGREICTLVDVD